MRAALQHLREEHASPRELGAAVALGVFVGALPLYGAHLGLCIALAWLFGLNKVTVYLAAQVSNPLFAPLLIGVGLVIGDFLRFGELKPLDLDASRSMMHTISILGGAFPDRFLSCMLGDAILGVLFAAVLGPLTYRMARRWQRERAPATPSS